MSIFIWSFGRARLTICVVAAIVGHIEGLAGVWLAANAVSLDQGPFRIIANCIAPRVIAMGRIMATVIPGTSQSNRARAEVMALRRLGAIEDCAKVVEFLATDLSDYATGAAIPIDGGLVRG
jgi:NAD(P)-dependent dehydrogenase (short-subunit alcohol dehydrogenase family)